MSGDTGRQSSSDVAHEAEDTRANLASTLEQLRNNLRPENVLEEVVSNAKIGASTIADNLVGLTRTYPLPSMIVATGAALFMGLAGKGFGRAREVSDEARLRRDVAFREADRFEPAPGRATVPQTAPTAMLADRTASLKQAASDALGTGMSRAADAVTSLKRQASDVYDVTSSNARDAMHDAAGYLPHSAGEARSKLSTFFDEQPLILGAIGMAIGAAIGAAIPMTRTEDEWMGETAHSVRQAAEAVARQEVDDLRALAGDTLDNVKRSATDHGLSSDNLNGLVRDVGSHAKAAVDQVGGSLDAGKARG